VAVSFDPHETWQLAAAKKKQYTDEYRRPGTESGWHFLTGEENEITRLTEAAGFRYKFDSQTQQWAHATGVLTVTPEGRISRYFYGVEYSPRDLRLSLVEASNRRIGAIADQVLLYCYQYDPATGKYGFVILSLVRVAGILTALGLLVFIVGAVRREHSGAAPIRKWT
jgi:protein SCO1